MSGNSLSDNFILNTDFTDSAMWDRLLDKLANFGIKFAVAILILIIGRKLIKLCRKLLRKALDKKGAETGVKQFLDSFVKFILYFVLVMTIAGFFGFQTTSLMAILGSAGVTLALALQGSLSNFTGGVLILILKPFKVGDYIKEDNKGNEGTVIEIQLFYTKLQTLDDKIVILPNGTLANTSLTNVTATPDRRVTLEVGISYDSDIRKAKDVILDVVKQDSMTLLERDIVVAVDSLDDSQIKLVAKYFVVNENYFISKAKIIEEIKLKFDENNITIPFNQLDVHMDTGNK